ncbi:MAG: hypothetical protein ABR575_10980 [Actinomycetota bacterium]
MKKALMIVCCVTAACGNPVAPLGESLVERTQQQPIADVLEVVCDSDGTRVQTARVRAFPDGVHARFENPAGATEYWIRALTNPDDGNHGGEVPNGRERSGWSDAPGKYLIGCYQKDETLPYHEPDDRYARYEVVDIDALWTPWDTDCEDPKTVDEQPLPEARSIDAVETWVRDRFDIHVGARVRPGYPETRWKGNPWVIRHESRVLVNFHAMEDNGTWVLHRAEGCTP